MQRRHFLKASGASALLLAAIPGCGGSDTETLAPLHGHTRRLVYAPGGGVIEWLPEANQVRAFNAAGVQQWAHLGMGQASHSLNVPAAVVFLAGRVYIADLGNSRIVVLDERGRWQFAFGGHGDTHGRFHFVKGIAAGPDGNLYCCDPGNHRVQVFDANGDWQGDLGGFGLEGFGLNGPGALAFDSAGRPHVIDRGNRRVVVFSAAGQGVRAYGGFGSGPGRMINPQAIAIDAHDNVYVADRTMQLVHIFDRSGTFLERQPVFLADGHYGVPVGLTWRPDGVLLVASTPDPSNGLIVRQYA